MNGIATITEYSVVSFSFLLWLAAGLLVSTLLLASVQANTQAAGYCLRSIKGAFLHLLMCLFWEWILIATLLVTTNMRNPVLAFAFGAIGAVFPSLLGDLLATLMNSRLAKIRAVWVLSKLVTSKNRAVRSAVQYLREADNLAWQGGRDDWRIAGRNRTARERSLRGLYEDHKEQIAARKRDVKLLDYAANVFPAYKFYLLVDHLGRGGLLAAMRRGATCDWGGKEKRLEVKGFEGRPVLERGKPRRRSDDPILRASIANGRGDVAEPILDEPPVEIASPEAS